MQRHVILFARFPQYGRVKTRLARDIGPLAALRFYKSTLASVHRRLQPMPNTTFHVSLTPDWVIDEGPGPMFDDAWMLRQGTGDLGQRMARAFRIPPPGPVLIIGSDIPDIRPARLESAFSALGCHDAVFGPSKDGGYWLVGLKRLRATPRHFMRGVRWSSENALKDTLATLPKHWAISYIEALDDIDTGSDYAAFTSRSMMGRL
ncbi:MAG: TIGR04282 family arsenosugar biosynthesis glycosyltransferase [Pseudomonadota bacterium]